MDMLICFKHLVAPCPRSFNAANNLNDLEVPQNNTTMKSKSSVLSVNFLCLPNTSEFNSQEKQVLQEKISAKKVVPTKITLKSTIYIKEFVYIYKEIKKVLKLQGSSCPDTHQDVAGCSGASGLPGPKTGRSNA